jgi:hypothetical protein
MHFIPKIIASFLIFSVILIIPEIHAQTESIPEVGQKLVKVTIDENGNVKVVHQIINSNQPRMLKFLDGTVSNLEFIDRFGRYESVEVFEGMSSIPILENQGELFVRYDLSDALVLKNDTWTMDFRYLEKTTFYVPEKLEMVHVNGNPLVFEENKGFVCHGCQVLLEYTFEEKLTVAVDQPNITEKVIECGWWDNFLAFFGFEEC